MLGHSRGGGTTGLAVANRPTQLITDGNSWGAPKPLGVAERLVSLFGSRLVANYNVAVGGRDTTQQIALFASGSALAIAPNWNRTVALLIEHANYIYRDATTQQVLDTATTWCGQYRALGAKVIMVGIPDRRISSSQSDHDVLGTWLPAQAAVAVATRAPLAALAPSICDAYWDPYANGFGHCDDGLYFAADGVHPTTDAGYTLFANRIYALMAPIVAAAWG